ncbi:hypothetical protein T07_3553 [Trichinella nelsoni]|uniref:Uncharacterized protein n=1 Tax=Trichinella nelsoni TaxID=6336 RepID=A0A0V0SGM0_9BILA|nr:hypothetical protein T07_3553 [Trichinella nelsoni]
MPDGFMGSERPFRSSRKQQDPLITFFNLFFKMSNIAIASDNLQHHFSMYCQCQSFYLSQTAADRH